jgi:hypothetical protein
VAPDRKKRKVDSAPKPRPQQQTEAMRRLDHDGPVHGRTGRTRHTVIIGLISALMSAGLAGCSASIEGAVGVKLDGAGRLVGVFDWCEGKGGAHTIILYLTDEDAELTERVIRLQRQSDHSAPSTEEVVLLDPAADWRTERAPSTLDDDRTYDLRAWNRAEGAVSDFPFRISELRDRAGSDEILIKRWDGKRYVAELHSPADFARHAETVCD